MIKRQKITSKSPIIRVLITIIPVGATVPGRPCRNCDIVVYRCDGYTVLTEIKRFCRGDRPRSPAGITILRLISTYNAIHALRATGDGRPYKIVLFIIHYTANPQFTAIGMEGGNFLGGLAGVSGGPAVRPALLVP